ncbi:MAG: SGNH/GDSL hydrolase family protein [Cyanobacteria bacterium P01_F01_bin.53]
MQSFSSIKKLAPYAVRVLGRCAAGSLALSLLLPLQALAKNYTELNIFGDSLVDSGNIFNLTGFPPSPPYANKLSNGDVWVQPFASHFGLAPSLSSEVLPGIIAGTTPPPADGINFALAGSLSSDLNTASPSDPTQPQLPGLQQQIQTFSQLAPVLAPDSEALYVLLAGGNDYNEALFRPERLTTTLDNLPNQITDNLTSATANLINLGAQHVLVANLPDLGFQPFAQQLNQIDPQNSTRLSSLSAEHNDLLQTKLSALSADSGAKITQLDLGGLFEEILANPDSFGFSDIANSCLANFQPGFVFEGVCDNPDEFVFWDNVHPTEALHNLIAQHAIETLEQKKDGTKEAQSVPEPSNILALLLFAGGAALVVSQRSRHRVEPAVQRVRIR